MSCYVACLYNFTCKIQLWCWSTDHGHLISFGSKSELNVCATVLSMSRQLYVDNCGTQLHVSSRTKQTAFVLMSWAIRIWITDRILYQTQIGLNNSTLSILLWANPRGRYLRKLAVAQTVKKLPEFYVTHVHYRVDKSVPCLRPWVTFH
jgi:hypothetical protein